MNLEYDFECPKCGHTTKGNVPDKCKQCGDVMWRVDIQEETLKKLRAERLKK